MSKMIEKVIGFPVTFFLGILLLILTFARYLVNILLFNQYYLL